MIVTDKKYYLETPLIKKLDLMADRCTSNRHKLDCLLLIDGYEGYGKTTFSVEAAYYVAHKTGRPFDHNNMFFDIDELIKFASTTEGQVIVWDEAALGGLTTETWNKSQIKLIKLMMTVRKKRHFIIFNIPYFHRLKDYFIDRAIGLIHVYARRQVELGRFMYFKKRNLMALYYAWKSSKKRLYAQFRDKSCSGSFPNALAKIIDEKEYDKMKDKAIASIGESGTVSKEVLKLRHYLYKIATFSIDKKLAREHFGVTPEKRYRWKKYKEDSANWLNINMRPDR